MGLSIMVTSLSIGATQSSLPPAVTSAGVAAVQAGSAAQAQSAQPVTPAAPTYFNPRFSFDRELGLMIMQVRDDTTGEVVTQFPSETIVREYRRQQTHETRQSAGEKTTNPAVTARSSGTRRSSGVEIEA
jgi:hypothetical protein